MIDKRITIPSIFILVVIVVLVVSINKPINTAGADNVENTALYALTNSNTEVLDTAENLEKTEQLPQEEQDVVEETQDLVEIRRILSAQATKHYMQSGWLHIKNTHRNFTDREEYIVVPDNDQIIPKNWVEKSWYAIDESNKVIGFYNEKRMSDDKVVYTKLISDGSKWKASNASFAKNLTIENTMNLNYLDILIAAGKTANHSVKYKTIEGRKVIGVSSTDNFPAPLSMDGVDQKIISLTRTSYYDWDTGQFISSKEWVTFENGNQMQINEDVFEVEMEVAPPTEILEKFTPIHDQP